MVSPTTKPPNPQSPTLNVLLTPDTLLLLHHLHPHDLLISQRVHPLWHALITTTHTLQCILGFRLPSHPPKTPTYNPILQRLFPPIFPTDSLTPTSPYFVPEEIHKLRFAHDTAYYKKFSRRNASWRRMYPMDIPCWIHKLVVHCEGDGVHARGSQAHRVIDEWVKGGQDVALGAEMRLVWDLVVAGLGAVRF
ncbi:hypothetical protein BO94DRAFT_590454 [Aspergillus sclerotioniger CBS 115572]|uniref:F-box domain-containing protein n=1 Tax=Aspergillus sclerotioniger CBS 115572 TaxID=1450535 RepID=A0A317V5V4_9EURO|nr:hypothetical protein BO94DRAFT_590454 [Aspergillus sclerotioniger CBS 115572]PWY69673.1 hypothetical protein BO94DRAFT_590454 [Aspergillus sclerotioniger CBS 115572]